MKTVICYDVHQVLRPLRQDLVVPPLEIAVGSLMRHIRPNLVPPQNIGDTVELLFDINRELAIFYGVNLVFSAPPDIASLEPGFSEDKWIKFRQAIQFPLNNSLKYFNPKRSKGDRRVEVKISREGSELFISNEDNGRGMTPFEVQKYGEEVRRGREVRKEGIVGAGMGALQLRKNVAALGGRFLGVQSEIEKGVIVTWSVPIKRATYVTIAAKARVGTAEPECPPLPDVRVAAQRLHKPLGQFPKWPTNTEQKYPAPAWHTNRQTDVLVQLESRSPHWDHVHPSQRALVIEQIIRIANHLGEDSDDAAKHLGLSNATHIYLRHGTTWRPMTEHSDIDMVVLLQEGGAPYTEKRIRWKPMDGVDREWHVGYIGLRPIMEGERKDAIFQKIDCFRGVCILGDDIFRHTPPLPSMGWLCFVNQILSWAIRDLFDVDERPESFWADKGYSRTLEAVHILNAIVPGVNTQDLLVIAQKGRRFNEEEIMGPADPHELLSERANRYGVDGIRVLWHAYHALGGVL